MLKNLYICSALLGGVMNIQAAPYGTWESPVTPKSLVEGATQLIQLEVDGDELYFLEGRPEEAGRSVFIRASDKKEMFPAPFYARTTVHEYGGKCGTVFEGTLYFTNFEDQHLYSVKPDQEPELINGTKGLRFADFVIHPNGQSLYTILEDHRGKGECINSIAKVDLQSGEITLIAEGFDFYAFPRISPDGNSLAYIAWNHPNMMWDQTELFVTDLQTSDTVKVSGSENESVSEPRWTPDGHLVYISDRSGFWKLYSEEGKCLVDEDFDFTSPLWVVGVSRTAFVTTNGKNLLLTVATDKGCDHFILKDQKTGELKTYKDHEFSFINDLHTLNDQVVFIAATPKSGPAIYKMDPLSGNFEVLKKSKDSIGFGEEFISEPETIEFPTENNKTAFGFYYPPVNPNYKTNLPKEKPPLIIFTHGGPTAHVRPILNAKIQFWTTRGFAVADINYGGSTGYGREYRNRLRRNWGIVDVDDCCNAALFLAKSGKIDQKRMAIEGGSAGGYTTLAALTFKDVFSAGTSYFGVSDLTLMIGDTHKYEARYLDSLVGKYPEEKERYDKYSPIHHTEGLSCPILLLQGAEDKIVLPNQAEVMYEALLKKDIPTAYILFEKEQHGFRIAENIIKSFEAQLYFYKRVFGIPVNKGEKPITIINLDT